MREKATDELFAAARLGMIEQIELHTTLLAEQLARDRLAERVMAAMAEIPRHEFVPEEIEPYAYLDQPLPIGYGKTISQPFIVALMTDLLDVLPSDTVLEVGTGLGYQAAVLSKLAAQVYSVEIIQELAVDAIARLKRQQLRNVEVRIGDGSRGWPEHAPFDRIIVTAAPDMIPPALLNQLAPGGRLVIPTGLEDAQTLVLAEKEAGGTTRITEILPVRFSQLMISH